MDGRAAGMPLIGIGVVAIVAGALAMTGVLGVGRLPGGVRIENGIARVCFPISPLLVLSVAVGWMTWIIRRLS